MLLLCNPSNEHGRHTSSLVSDQLFLFLTALLLSGVTRRPLEPVPAKPGCTPFRGLLCEHLEVRYLAQGNLGRALNVLTPPPKHFPCFVCMS